MHLLDGNTANVNEPPINDALVIIEQGPFFQFFDTHQLTPDMKHKTWQYISIGNHFKRDWRT